MSVLVLVRCMPLYRGGGDDGDDDVYVHHCRHDGGGDGCVRACGHDWVVAQAAYCIIKPLVGLCYLDSVMTASLALLPL